MLSLRRRQPMAVRPASEHAVLAAASRGQLIAAAAVSSAVLAPDIGCQVASFGWMDGWSNMESINQDALNAGATPGHLESLMAGSTSPRGSVPQVGPRLSSSQPSGTLPHS